MNKKTIKVINRVLRRFGLRLEKEKSGVIFKSKHVHDPQYSYLLDPDLQDKLNLELSKLADDFFTRHFTDLPNLHISSPDRIRKFIQTWGGREFFENTGGSGFHNAFWLYLFTSALNPALIIESGVWKGHTTWLLKQAAPEAEIHGFDISLKRLEFNHPEVSFHERDWNGHQFESVEAERSLVFFDCHVNHAQRIIEASQKGFKHLVFDDNPPLHKIYSYGQPGFPTAHMLWERDLPSEEVQWLWKGKPHQARIDPDQAERALKLIKRHLVFPDVGGPTRYGGFSFLTYIEI